jgi:hypothetical protein
MATVTLEEREAMLRLRNIMEGDISIPATDFKSTAPSGVELAGPGQITSSDVNAMADVLKRLNNLSNHVVNDMITESANNSQIQEAMATSRTATGIKVGRYQIDIKEDHTRLAGKQFYSIYNGLTKDTIANDISLYETALAAVRLLNSGKFVNSPEIRQLFEQDDVYTSHRVDALTYKRKLNNIKDPTKRDLYESRLQGCMDRCMNAKKLIKKLAKNGN